ncbi:MAG: protein translocase subunit SecF, partial [Verrucomicrobiae bacterium]|nr:protein translocase subunit SecF [Verrucomicrobiae bacterium]
ITSLITSLILFMVATGTVRGFAVTLTIGILASLFAALLVTRVCFSWATDTGFCKKLTFLDMSPKRIFDFLGHRRACIVGSIIVIIISLIAVPMVDPRGVDLKGGDLLTIHSTGGLTVKQVEESLSKADIGRRPIVQSQSPVGSEGEFITVRSDFETAPKVIAAIEASTGEKLPETTTESIGSAVGSEMLKTSMIALGLGLLAILVYVTIRYEFAFALGAIVALVHDLIITTGVLAITGQELSLITVGALLTIAGYSINDTIVVFDRVREGLATKRGELRDVINYSLNATLSRTILTGATTLLTVLTLLIFGGPSLSNFAFTLLIGIVVGTYSSIFIASPIVLWWARRTGTNLRREVLDIEAGRVGGASGPGTPASA